MPKQKIYKIKFDSDSDALLTYEEPCIEAGDIVEDTGEPSLEEWAELCDHSAENCNWHEFVGVHQKLAELLTTTIGYDRATVVLKLIAEHGGLHELNA